MSGPFKVFDIAGASFEETEEVRELLSRKKVRFYEPPPANFGKSNAAIWVRTENEFAKARMLVNEYQAARKALQKNYKEDDKKGPSSNNRTKIFFLVFVLIIVVWMYFFGAWRP